MSEMKPTGKTLKASLSLVILLFLMLSFAASVLGQRPGDSNETSPTAATPQPSETGEHAIVPLASPTPIDCDNPIPGQVAKVVEDNEIIVALMTIHGHWYWKDYSRIQLAKLDNKSNNSTQLVGKWDWRNENDDRDDINWPVVATGDVDGDGKDEVISAFRDASNYLQVVSLKNPEVNEASRLEYNYWRSSADTRSGHELAYFDIATGNLGGDKADEVVVAFMDNDYALQVVLLNGKSDGGIRYLDWWRSTSHNRGEVRDVSVDIGDLDGDGYDDEIVLAFVDAGLNLQVVVLEYTPHGVKEIGWEYWTDHDLGDIDYPFSTKILDVTTGNFDGAYGDEIAVAVKDGSKALQIMQIVFVPDASALRDRVNASGWWRNGGHRRDDVDYISIASGDIEDDGYDEIIVAFADDQYNLSTVTLDGESGSPHLHGSYRNSRGQLDQVELRVGGCGRHRRG